MVRSMKKACGEVGGGGAHSEGEGRGERRRRRGRKGVTK